jgi:hypothetical protein
MSPIAAALQEFQDYHPNAPHDPPVYNPEPLAAPPDPFQETFLRPRLTAVPALVS